MMKRVEEYNKLVDNRRAELMEMTTKDLKAYFETKGLENPKGYWKMNKSDMTEKILESEKDLLLEEATIIAKHMADAKEVDKKERIRRAKFVYNCYNLNNELIFTTTKQSELVDFALEHMICNGDWVYRSIRENVPVMIGLKKNQDPSEFKPRHSGKYQGNFYRFIKTEIKEDKAS